jgi:hypothetical protein
MVQENEDSGPAGAWHAGPVDKANWWQVRRAHNRKPATYTCPFCGRYLLALSDHMLILPEGDPQRRRHAHSDCVLAARRAGRLPTKDEWLRTQPRPQGLFKRVAERLKRQPG